MLLIFFLLLIQISSRVQCKKLIKPRWKYLETLLIFKNSPSSQCTNWVGITTPAREVTYINFSIIPSCKIMYKP